MKTFSNGPCVLLFSIFLNSLGLLGIMGLSAFRETWWILPKGSSLSSSNVVDGPGKFCTVLHMRGILSHEHPWESVPGLYFYRDSEEIEKDKQAAAEMTMTKEEFQGEWTVPLLDSLLFCLRLQTALQVSRGPPCLVSNSLLEPSAGHWRLVRSSHCSGPWMGRNNHWVALSCSSTKANKMEIRLTENKQFLKKK